MSRRYRWLLLLLLLQLLTHRYFVDSKRFYIMASPRTAYVGATRISKRRAKKKKKSFDRIVHLEFDVNPYEKPRPDDRVDQRVNQRRESRRKRVSMSMLIRAITCVHRAPRALLRNNRYLIPLHFRLAFAPRFRRTGRPSLPLSDGFTIAKRLGAN